VTTLIFPYLEGGIGRYTPEIKKKKKKKKKKNLILINKNLNRFYFLIKCKGHVTLTLLKSLEYQR